MVQAKIISYNIMAHRSREENVKEIRKKVGNIKTIWSETEEFSLEDVWNTRKECLKDHLNKKKDFCVTIQDDSVVCNDFKNKAQEFINKFGEKAVYNFFFSQTAFSRDQFNEAVGRGYLKTERLKNEICLAIPYEIIPELLELNSENEMIRLLAERYPTYYSIPSLVNHKGDHSLWKDWKEPINAVCWWFADDPQPEMPTRLELRRRAKMNKLFARNKDRYSPNT
jgi:hypothetical protein